MTISHEAFEKYNNRLKEINPLINEIRNQLKTKGPLSSADIKCNQKVNWDWSPTRAARAILESMYFWGELLIFNKKGSRKYYDFTEKHIPSELLTSDDPNLTIQQYHDWYVKRRISSIGMLWKRSGDAWLGIKGMNAIQRKDAFSRLLKKKEIIEVTIDKSNHKFYINKEDRPLLLRIIENKREKPAAFFIAPLDNLIWDRKLIKELFDFEYVWEVYKPVHKRKFGYYVLPVLYNDTFVARFEAKFDRNSHHLHLLNWWWEKDINRSIDLLNAIKLRFKEFLKFLGDIVKCCVQKS